MTSNLRKTVLALAGCMLFSAGLSVAAPQKPVAPLVIQEQGSFTVGGTVIQSPGSYDPLNLSSGGQTLHGDHARVFYQVPLKARKLPLVMWHGFGQSTKT